MAVNQMIMEGVVSVTDLSDDLYMVHFVEGHQENAGQFRGDVFSWDRNECVCPSTGLIAEKVWSNGQATIPICMNWIPGTIVRLFFYSNRWHVATNRRLDAFSCAWDKETFGAQLLNTLGLENIEAFDNWCATQLDTTAKYVLSISMDESVPVAQWGVYLLGAFVGANNDFVLPHKIMWPQGILPFDYISEDIQTHHEPKFGYLYRDETTGRWTKILNAKRARDQFIVGNEPDTRRRYHELMQLDPTGGLLQEFFLLRPDAADIKLKDDEDWDLYVRNALFNDCKRRADGRGQLNHSQFRVWKTVSTLYASNPAETFPYRLEALGLWHASLQV